MGKVEGGPHKAIERLARWARSITHTKSRWWCYSKVEQNVWSSGRDWKAWKLMWNQYRCSQRCCSSPHSNQRYPTITIETLLRKEEALASRSPPTSYSRHPSSSYTSRIEVEDTKAKKERHTFPSAELCSEIICLSWIWCRNANKWYLEYGNDFDGIVDKSLLPFPFFRRVYFHVQKEKCYIREPRANTCEISLW